jgi:hypothetical protein
MGEGEQRRSKRSARYDTRELAVLSKKQTPSEADWDEKIAAGSQKLPVALARRTHTVEVSPDQIDEATEAAPSDTPPDDPT